MSYFVAEEKSSVDATFRLDSNYPIDLYYLMDMSESMQDNKVKLVDLGSSLGMFLNIDI